MKRGSKREVFAHTTNEYMCVGTQACQAEKGLNCGQHRIKKGFTNEHWDILFKTLKKGEHAFDAYSPTDVIRHVQEANKLIGYQTMNSSPTSDSIKESCRFNGIGFGINVFFAVTRTWTLLYQLFKSTLTISNIVWMTKPYVSSVFQG